jgi:hypothetical protein
VQRVLFMVALTGCSACETPPPECTTTALDPACLPQYQPTFQNVYSNTIQQDCGSSEGSCHGSSDSDSGLSFADAPTAYQALVDHVKAGDAACSELVVRTHDTGQDYSMPPDEPLGESERCALLQWVLAGTPQ